MRLGSSNPSAGVAYFLYLPQGPAQTRFNRLIVFVPDFVPDQDIDEPALARRLWLLGAAESASSLSPSPSSISALSLPHPPLDALILCAILDWAGEAQLRLTLLTALLREKGMPVSSQIRFNIDWIGAAWTVYLPGHLIVSHAEQTMLDTRRRNLNLKINGLSVKPKHLSSFLPPLGMPVYEPSGTVSAPIKRSVKPSVKRSLRVWLTPVAVTLGSLVLQITFFNWAKGWAEWARQAALVVSSTVEWVTLAWLARS